jgi:hypothetical protein
LEPTRTLPSGILPWHPWQPALLLGEYSIEGMMMMVMMSAVLQRRMTQQRGSNPTTEFLVNKAMINHSQKNEMGGKWRETILKSTRGEFDISNLSHRELDGNPSVIQGLSAISGVLGYSFLRIIVSRLSASNQPSSFL